MPHYTGSGLPAQRTATVFDQTSERLSAIFSDVGLTLPLKNPFPLINGAYDFYTASAAYVAIGVSRPIYLDLGMDDPVDPDLYLAPSTFPSPLAIIQPQTGTLTQLTNGAPLIWITSATDIFIQGIKAGRYDGQQITIVAKGAGAVYLQHQNAGAAAADRLINFVTSGDTPLAGSVGTATYAYDTTTARWRLIAHEQGEWISDVYAAGHYTGNGLMTVTVDAGDVSRNTFYIKGRCYMWGVQLDNFSTGGTPNTDVKIAIPGGYTIADDAQNVMVVVNNGGGVELGRCFVNATTPGNFSINRPALANWANGVNNNVLSGSIFFPIA